MSTVRYFAAAKEAAGLGVEQVDAATLADALDTVRGRHDDRFTTVLGRCSFVVDGAPVGGRDHAAVALEASSVVDVLPPFAGG
ncbi:MAG: thiamine biosynthesis protein ThiS [Frankiales bacterium]|nr:thiamine biosynthesis protein ThiS [Frankiales bacterium]